MLHAARASFTLRACLWQGRRAHLHASTPPSPRRAKISHHQLASVLPALSNRHKMQLESSVTSRKQTTAPNSNQHKFSPNPAPALRAPAITTYQSPITPFLFNTNKAHRIITLLRALLKTKKNQFSIQYKFALRGTGSPAAEGTLVNRPAGRFILRSRSAGSKGLCFSVLHRAVATSFEPNQMHTGPPAAGGQDRQCTSRRSRATNHDSQVTNHDSRLTGIGGT